MTPITATLTACGATIVVSMLVLWLIGTLRHDVSVVDPFWGIGFAMVAWVAALLQPTTESRTWLLVGLTTVWGLRLSLFLLWRNWGRGEDRRYAAMRSAHGPRFWWRSLFTVFLLQAALLWLVALPIQVAIAGNRPTAWTWWDLTGVTLWSIGLFFESVGDWQLARFQGDPANAGKVMDRGLWRYTRHPNYFGDFCVWWGLYAIAAAGGAWFTMASPALMSFLLLRVSGVRLLEQTIVDRRPGYTEYQARTNAFFPGRPAR